MTNKIKCDHDCSFCEILCSDAIKKHNENLSNMQYENIKLKKENAELLERLNDIESVCEGTSEDAVCMKVEKLKERIKELCSTVNRMRNRDNCEHDCNKDCSCPCENWSIF